MTFGDVLGERARLQVPVTMPPSTERTVPWTKPAASEASQK